MIKFRKLTDQQFHDKFGPDPLVTASDEELQEWDLPQFGEIQVYGGWFPCLISAGNEGCPKKFFDEDDGWQDVPNHLCQEVQ